MKESRTQVLIVACLLAVTLIASIVSAQFVDGEATVTTVAEAKKLKDDAPVTLQGNILRSLGDEKFVFADKSGKINVEIDDDVWGGLKVDKNDTVEISGEVDRDGKKIEIDVKSIRKM